VDSLDIAIAGAGPGGLAAALFLSRAGRRVRLQAGALAGQLLSPFNAIGLEPAPMGEVR